ncbi:MAG: TetR/AcrR family transcriptional regulator [Lachnospiraceae bacterium]|nr:TetR/AcrR family transcriptional regulator [Lachnospiraceae bacterium]
MSDKAAKKKQYILDTARGVFSTKGFKDVTMKDIVEACDISRGGLYIYFSSTEDILVELLKQEMQETDDVFSRNLGDEYTAGDILAIFLKEQKKELLSKKNNLSIAVYEYLFSLHQKGSTSTDMKNRFKTTVKLISKLIDAGVENGEFYCEDSEGAARNIMYVLEGLKMAANTTGVTEKDIDDELLYIMGGLIIEE